MVVECDEPGFSNHAQLRFHGKSIGKKTLSPKKQGTWERLIYFLEGYRNNSLSKQLASNVLNYQMNKITKTCEALIELFPLPSPKIKLWNYQKASWVAHSQFPYLIDRTQYERNIARTRSQQIFSQLKDNVHVQLILCYGAFKTQTNLRDTFKELEDKLIRGGIIQKNVLGTIGTNNNKIHFKYYININRTQIVIFTNHPAKRHGTTVGDWHAFGQAIKTIFKVVIC